jgi:hypothetical protein
MVKALQMTLEMFVRVFIGLPSCFVVLLGPLPELPAAGPSQRSRTGAPQRYSLEHGLQVRAM